MALKDKKVGFVGSGAMGEALLSGLLNAGTVSKSSLYCYDQNADKLKAISDKYGVKSTKSNLELVQSVDVVILAIKPYVVADVLREIGNQFQKGQLLISIAAGISTDFIEGFLPKGLPVVRVMPNTPSLIGMGAAALALGKAATSKDGKITEEILAAAGKVVTVNENLIDGVTGLSGSGPAYVYVILEALIDAGVLVGLPRDVATTLATQTVIGAAQMVAETGDSPSVLKEKVTTPGGTTIVGLHQLEKGKLRATLMNAVVEATRRSKELSKE